MMFIPALAAWGGTAYATGAVLGTEALLAGATVASITGMHMQAEAIGEQAKVEQEQLTEKAKYEELARLDRFERTQAAGRVRLAASGGSLTSASNIALEEHQRLALSVAEGAAATNTRLGLAASRLRGSNAKRLAWINSLSTLGQTGAEMTK